VGRSSGERETHNGGVTEHHAGKVGENSGEKRAIGTSRQTRNAKTKKDQKRPAMGKTAGRC